MSEAAAVMGHNQPPLDETLQMILDNVEDLENAIDTGLGGAPTLKRINDLVAAKARIPAKIETQEQAEAITTFTKQLSNIMKAIEDGRKKIKAPALDLGKRIDARAAALKAPLLEAEKTARKVLTEYLEEKDRQEREQRRLEQERLAAEAAKRAEEARTDDELNDAIAAEERLAAASSAPVEKTHVRNSYGNHAGLRKTWEFDLTDLSLVPREYLVLDEKKVKAAIKDGVRTIPGLNIFEKSSVSVR